MNQEHKQNPDTDHESSSHKRKGDNDQDDRVWKRPKHDVTAETEISEVELDRYFDAVDKDPEQIVHVLKEIKQLSRVPCSILDLINFAVRSRPPLLEHVPIEIQTIDMWRRSFSKGFGRTIPEKFAKPLIQFDPDLIQFVEHKARRKIRFLAINSWIEKRGVANVERIFPFLDPCLSFWEVALACTERSLTRVTLASKMLTHMSHTLSHVKALFYALCTPPLSQTHVVITEEVTRHWRRIACKVLVLYLCQILAKGMCGT